MSANDTHNRPHHVGYIDPNWPNPNGPGDADIIIYGYVPSFALAATAVTLFFVSTILHIFQIVRYKTWWFIPMAVATTMEIVGYIFRSLSAKVDPYRVNFFVLMYFFIVVAPVFISASIYLCLSKLLEAIPASKTPFNIPAKVILAIFIVNDVVSTVLQVAGAALIGASESKAKNPDTGNHILLGGLSYQVFSFTVWLCLYFVYLLQFRGNESVEMTRRQKIFSVALLVAALGVYLRTIFRLCETSEGVFGHLQVTEGFFAGLEFAPIVVAVYTMNIWHPNDNPDNAAMYLTILPGTP